MSLILSGTDGLSDVDGSAATPAIRGTDANTGIFFPAADTIAFSEGGAEAMRIDSSGNLSIGTTTSSGKFTILDNSGGAGVALITVLTNGVDANCYLSLTGSSATDKRIVIGPSTGTALAFQTNATERMRIDSSGNVGIGESASIVRKLCITASGTTATTRAGIQLKSEVGTTAEIYQGPTSNNALIFEENGSERMRIDASGNLLVGQTTQISGERLGVGSGSNTLVAWFQQNTNTSGYNGMVIGLGSNGNNTSTSFLRGNTNAVGNWYLYGNGTTSFSSDQRLKKNIETTRDGYLEDLCKLRVVKYNWKNDADGTPKELGLIAQDVEQVFSGLVQDDLNKVSEEDDTTYKQLKVSVLPFMLLKAMQEQQALITALTARITALETP